MHKVPVIPAIDLKGGRCVRLRQGRAEDETVYSEDPVAMAVQWAEQGATRLHVVDLDGAFQGAPAHLEVIGRICKALTIPVQCGGGLRDDAAIEAALAAGVERVILGTRVLAERDGVKRAVEKWGAAIVVGLDARDGKVQVRGWTETTDSDVLELAKSVEADGVSTIIYTDTSRDGMLQGVNTDAMRAMCDAVGCDVIASGGVTDETDIQRLSALACPNLVGVIAGKALYEGRVTLQALESGGSE